MMGRRDVFKAGLGLLGAGETLTMGSYLAQAEANDRVLLMAKRLGRPIEVSRQGYSLVRLDFSGEELRILSEFR